MKHSSRNFITTFSQLCISGLLLSQLIACTDNNSSANSNNSEDSAIYAYIGAGADFKVVNIQDPANPTLLSTTATESAFLVETAPFGAIVASFDQLDATYVDAMSTNDPAVPVVSNLPKTAPFLRVTDIYVDDSHIFIGDEYRGLHVYDLVNFDFQFSVLEYDTMSFTKLNDEMYIIHQTSGALFSGLQKYNFSDIQAPVSLATNASDIDANSYPTEERTHHSWVENDGTNIYVANLEDKKLKKMNSTDLTVLSEVDIQGHVSSIAIDNGFAYITVLPHASQPTLLTGDDAIKVVNLSNMTLVDSKNLNQASGVAVFDNHVYVVDDDALHIYSSNAGILTLVTSFAAGAGRDVALGNIVSSNLMFIP